MMRSKKRSKKRERYENRLCSIKRKKMFPLVPRRQVGVSRLLKKKKKTKSANYLLFLVDDN